MRDLVPHLLWIGSHFVRTVIEQDSSHRLIAGLASEVKILQAELHRAHRLLEGYNLAVEREESAARYSAWGHQLLVVLLIILTGLLAKAWLWPDRRVGPVAPVQVLGDTGGSSDSESAEDQVPNSWAVAAVRPKGSGPVRPSILGKGVKK